MKGGLPPIKKLIKLVGQSECLCFSPSLSLRGKKDGWQLYLQRIMVHVQHPVSSSYGNSESARGRDLATGPAYGESGDYCPWTYLNTVFFKIIFMWKCYFEKPHPLENL